MVSFQVERIEDLRAEAEPLLARHWEEIALDKDTVPLDPDWESYARIENAGALHITTARDGAALVGYACYALGRNLHYRSLFMAESDIFWLAPEYRKGMTGVKLLKAAERFLAQIGVNKIVNKVKLHNDVGGIFEHLGYRAIERVYAKRIV